MAVPYLAPAWGHSWIGHPRFADLGSGDMAERILIFDTTLRDGEQSPGATMTTPEKIEVARQLARLGVDIIEAGYPAASPGDLEAVQLIGREVKGVVVAGLARVQFV